MAELITKTPTAVKYKLKMLEASTLIEVLISMVIVAAVFVTGITIYVNVTRSGVPVSQQAASRTMEALLQESIAGKDWGDQEIQKDSIDYLKTVKAYAGYRDLLLIEIVAKQNSREIGRLRQIVKKEIPGL